MTVSASDLPADAGKSSVPLAYITVVVIWATTPLAMVWSSESISPIMAAFSRMALAAVVGTMILGLFSIALPWSLQALRSYAFAVLGIYGAMATTYMAIPYVSSGLISLMFGLSPMISGLLVHFFLRESVLSPLRVVALFISLCGLFRVLSDDVLITEDTLLGVAMLLGAVSLFSISGVLVKGAGKGIHPLAQTVGALWLSLPCYLLSWWLMDGTLPSLEGAGRSIMAIVYLGIGGSLLGFVCYFYILKQLSPATVALITLITPVIALSLGNLLNGEALTPALISGAGLIIMGLALYQWGHQLRLLLRKSGLLDVK